MTNKTERESFPTQTHTAANQRAKLSTNPSGQSEGIYIAVVVKFETDRSHLISPSANIISSLGFDLCLLMCLFILCVHSSERDTISSRTCESDGLDRPFMAYQARDRDGWK
jgi:hypothetical protein